MYFASIYWHCHADVLVITISKINVFWHSVVSYLSCRCDITSDLRDITLDLHAINKQACRPYGELYLVKTLPRFEHVLTQEVNKTGAFCTRKTILRHNFVK
jgi:hypothetical protein